jgi:hypothetical protein
MPRKPAKKKPSLRSAIVKMPSATPLAEELKRDYPEQVLAQMQGLQMPGRLFLDDLLGGDENEAVRRSIMTTGKYVTPTGSRELRIQTRTGEDGRVEVVALAALARDPGRTQDYLDAIQDFGSVGAGNRTQKLQQYRKIYETEGLINNAVNKIAALIGVGGRFKVRKAKKGKARKPVEQLQTILDYVANNVNAASEVGVVTSERGMRSIIHAGVRQALIEGDWIGRQQWVNVEVPAEGRFSLPMTIQTLGMQQLEPVEELSGLGELWYWRPDSRLRQLIVSGDKNRPEVTKIIQKLVDPKLKSQLVKEPRVLLEPALLLHVKYRGYATSPYGESIIEPAKLGIRYSRALNAVDLVTMENIVNRLTIIKVGTGDPKSPYFKPDVAAARSALMQSFLNEVGPSMIIVWQGDDVSVEDVGSTTAVLDLEERFRVADHKIKSALGLPDAILFGSTGEGSSAGWASVIGAAAQMQELANAFAAVLTTLGERIAMENGFDNIELMWEFDKSLLIDVIETRVQNRADYLLGVMSIRSMIAASGRDPDAEFLIKCTERGLDPGSTTFEDAFTPPQGLQGQAPGEIQGQGPGKVPGAGRTPDKLTSDGSSK